ncbi:hypothetical protein GA0070617_2322 [Micromonospora yangpuensis]|uniref:Flavin reductase n=2 Tax=Micromonospora yangpuensis TaxID=683228 RepID=A0A1C6UH95_9ACTN|nr:hypothetical protein GA0070617_2322 [Micromonospora yangpuensis]
MMIPITYGADASHVPTRPTWDCTACAEPWPCTEYRSGDASMQIVGALIYLTQLAIRDMRYLPAPEVVRRFVFCTPLSDADARAVALDLMRSRQPLPDITRTRHTPMRPLWGCSACRKDWPCGPAQAALLRVYEGEPDALVMYLGAMLAHAGDQLHQLGQRPHPATLDQRFLAWARDAIRPAVT